MVEVKDDGFSESNFPSYGKGRRDGLVRSTELAQVLWWDSVRLRCSPCHSVCLSPLWLCVSFLDVAADVCVCVPNVIMAIFVFPSVCLCHNPLLLLPLCLSNAPFILFLCYKIILA